MLGNAAGEGSLCHDGDVRALMAEAVEHGKQIEAGVFVSGEVEVPALERAQLLERGAGFVAQSEQAFSVFAQELAGGCKCALARDALEERLADFFFETANGMADGRLCAVQARSSTRESAFFNDGEKGFELREIHTTGFRQCFGIV